MPEEYIGPSGVMKRPSRWLSAEDLEGWGDVEVEIECVFRHGEVEFDQGRTERNVFSVKFVGKDKQLVLNATNRKSLAAKFGTNTADWKGHKIVLFVQDGVRFGSSKVKGVRIR